MNPANSSKMARGFRWILVLVAAGLVFAAWALLPSCGSDSTSSPAESRSWYYESEFSANPGLQATPDQVVILDICPGAGFEAHEIPYYQKSEEGFLFAVPSDDPFMTRMEISDRFGNPIAVTQRGDGGVYLEELPASYRITAYHSEMDPPGEGTAAFIHGQWEGTDVALFGKDATADNDGTSPVWPRHPAYVALQFKSGNYKGQYLGLSDQETCYDGKNIHINVLKPVPLDTKDKEFQNREHLFSLEATDYNNCNRGTYPPFEGNYLFHSWVGENENQCFSYLFWPCDYQIKCPPSQDNPPVDGVTMMPSFWHNVALAFPIQDMGDGTVTLWPVTGYTTPCSPLYAAENGYVYFTQFSSVADADTFKLVDTFRFYKDGTQIRREELRSGEVALYEEENYTGVAVVLSESFRQMTLIPLEQVASVSFGHYTDTTVQFFGSPDFTNLIRTVGVDVPAKLDLQGTDIGSIRIFDSKKVLLSSKECPYCNLAGVDLSGLNLDAADLSHADLMGASFHYASLKKADLSNALLNGTNLSNANLMGASLYDAFLNGNPEQELSAAILTGAYLKNANLAGADLGGADLSNASFYSGTYNDTGCAQDPDHPGFTKNCASAQGANMNAAKFTGAYLAGADFTGTTATAADFSNAVLSGAIFKNAHLDWDNPTSARTLFVGAFVGGTSFSNATVEGANFENAYVNFKPNGDCMLFTVSSAHTRFPGFSYPYGDSPCVMFAYSDPTSIPVTDRNAICPDGNNGPCDTGRWSSPLIPREQSTQPSSGCLDKPPLCDVDHIDPNW